MAREIPPSAVGRMQQPRQRPWTSAFCGPCGQCSLAFHAAPSSCRSLRTRCRESKTKPRLELHFHREFCAIACCEGDVACTPPSHCVLRTSRINNPEGDMYEVRECCQDGCCRGSRDRSCWLPGPQADAVRYRGSEVAGCPAAIAGGRGEELGGSGGERRPGGQPGGQRCAEHCEPGVGCCSGRPVGGRCDQREDQPHVQAVDLEVRAFPLSSKNAAHLRGVFLWCARQDTPSKRWQSSAHPARGTC